MSSKPTLYMYHCDRRGLQRRPECT